MFMGTLLTLITGSSIALTIDWTAALPPLALAAFVAWPMMPLALAGAAGWFMQKSKPALLCCSFGLWLAFSLMASLYVYIFHLNPDPQGGLILIFGPLYALGALLQCLLVALFFFFRKPRSGALAAPIVQEPVSEAS